MERYFYFRDVADEANDSDDGASVMVPVKNITAIDQEVQLPTLIYGFKVVKTKRINLTLDLQSLEAE